MKTPEGQAVRCPKCNLTDVRYCQSWHIGDLFRAIFRLDALRCRNCRRRFYARTVDDDD
jgi:DNA-directed RNA polymerase subunit RPC12/RpoP